MARAPLSSLVAVVVVATGETIYRQAVDARELVNGPGGEYVYAEGKPPEAVVVSTALEEIKDDPSTFAQSIITANATDAGKIIAAVDLADPKSADLIARALELETAAKSRASVLTLLRDAQKALKA